MVSGVQLMSKKMPSILFVCVGNICRSPALKGMMEHLLKEKGIHADIESCGLRSFFLGNPPDRRVQSVFESHRIPLHDHAKMFEASFFDRFDMIFCVTKDVLSGLKAMAHTKEHQNKIFLASRFSKKYKDQELPDPYFGGKDAFEFLWDRVDDACRGIIECFFVDCSS